MESALDTSELLELILEVLDPRTLLTSATRVCHYWNSLIQDSRKIQRALFLLPERQSTCYQTRANPLLSPHITRLALTQPKAEFDSLLAAQGDTLNKINKFLRTEATWCQMLVQQPPATKLGVWKIESSRQGFQHKFEEIDVSSTGGLVMSQLLDFVKQWAEKGYTWSLFWGEHGKDLFEREKNSLLVLKVGISAQSSLLKMKDSSHIVVKLTRWSRT